MRKFNFLEVVGIVALSIPVAAATALTVLLTTGTMRVYTEPNALKVEPGHMETGKPSKASQRPAAPQEKASAVKGVTVDGRNALLQRVPAHIRQILASSITRVADTQR